MPAYILCVILSLYFFRNKILGVACSTAGKTRENTKTAVWCIFISLIPGINTFIAFVTVIHFLWTKIFFPPSKQNV